MASKNVYFMLNLPQKKSLSKIKKFVENTNTCLNIVPLILQKKSSSFNMVHQINLFNYSILQYLQNMDQQMDNQSNQHPSKRKAPEQLQQYDLVKKKVHKNPMSILQQALQKQDNEQIKQSDLEDNKPLDKLEDIEILQESTDDGCIHQVFYPKGYQRTQYHGAYNAKNYKFKLDPFQQKSIHAIECQENVLVCAHTSAGKTAIAQYAIATSLKKNSRVVYTSPIKALSNQKYRDLKDQFDDVGLVTGDASIDPQSTCIVMTTQILRNMIYRGSSVIRQIKWVIFDEVHYMRDRQRGVVWQETIIMLPKNVKYIFLSATIGNPEQFACWITKLRKQPCNVVYTDYRPVPLQHYLCPTGGEGLYMVVDDNGKFHDDQFNKAIQVLGQDIGVVGMDKKKKKNLNQGSDLAKIIKVVIQRDYNPVIIFSFSKKDVEAYAKSICLKYDLTTKLEKEKIEQIFSNAISMLEQEDQKLPQITTMLPILMKGIGIHHGGLFPILKQLIQILFQQGYLKILFSTQTFSMGLNMPAKTVVFTSMKKWDGQKNRWITGGQYIQMSGRAGRRGKDKKGLTMLMIDEKIQPQIAKGMLKGRSDNLLSSFYININMLLNAQRLEDIDQDYILARSFLQFQHEAKLPQALQKYEKLKIQYESMNIANQEILEKLYLLDERAKQYKQKIRKLTFTPLAILPYLPVGRIVKIKDGQVDWGYGVSINFNKKQKHKKIKGQQSADCNLYLVDAMIYVKPRQNNQQPQPQKFSENGELVVLTFSLACIYEITSLKISNLPNDLNSQANKTLIFNTLKSLTKDDKKIQSVVINSNNPEVYQLNKALTQAKKQIEPFEIYRSQLEEYTKKRNLYNTIKQSHKKIKQFTNIVLKKEKKAYLKVMKKIGLIEKNVVTLKGSAACEISSGHEILLVNLLFSGFFNGLTSIEIASLLTCLVHEEKSQSDRKYTKNPRIKSKLQQLINNAKQIFHILHQCKVQIQQDQYIGSIKEQLIEVTYQWCSGASFQVISKMTDSYEGSIIRTLRRLNQLLKQMASASRVIGNHQLQKQFEEGRQKVYRGLVSAASLYLV